MEDPKDFTRHQQDLNDLVAASITYELVKYDQDFKYPKEVSHETPG